eukprot:g416.t1
MKRRTSSSKGEASASASEVGGGKSAKTSSSSSSSPSSSSSAATAAAATAAIITAPTSASSLTALPKVVVEAILEHADAKDLGRIDCVARVFHGGMIETVLRRLAQRATGRAVPLGDPPRNVVAPRTWTQRLLREMLRRWWKLPGGAPKAERVTGSDWKDFSLRKDGAVYSQGEGFCGRLGHGNEEDQDVPKLIEALSGVRVCAVSASYAQSLFLTEDGKVYSCGVGDNGMLGHGNREEQHVPKLIEALSGVRVCAVSAAPDHRLFLTEDGKVYSCGSGGYGQLGHGNEENQYAPKLIEALSGVRVCAMSAGHYHSLFLTEDGKAYSCGYGGFGRLGHGNEEWQHVPKLIEALSGVRVCAVSAGNSHSLFLTEDGKAYSCGYGIWGKLGHGNEEHQLVPKLIEALSDVRVCAVSAGDFHSLFLTEDGQVYSCGGGDNGELGHGNEETQLVPEHIETFHPGGPRVCVIHTQGRTSKFITDSGETWQTGCIFFEEEEEDVYTPRCVAPAPPN